MKNFIQKFGLISICIILGVNLVALAVFGSGEESYANGEIVGYSTILVVELLILVAIAQFKKKENGVISFGQAFKLGTGIAALGGLAFAAYNVVYVLYIDSLFNEKYFAYQEGLDINAADFAEKYAAFAAEQGFFLSVPFQTLLMFLTVFLIGLIISVIGGLVFQSKGKVSAA